MSVSASKPAAPKPAAPAKPSGPIGTRKASPGSTRRTCAVGRIDTHLRLSALDPPATLLLGLLMFGLLRLRRFQLMQWPAQRVKRGTIPSCGVA